MVFAVNVLLSYRQVVRQKITIPAERLVAEKLHLISAVTVLIKGPFTT